MPLVDVTIAGKPFTMVLDSGSPFTLLSHTVVQQLSLPVTSDPGRGTDAAGNSVHYARVNDPRLTIDGWGRFTGRRVLVTRLPKFFDKLGIAGLLSTRQLVASGQSVVIDPRRHWLATMPDSSALASLGNAPGIKMSLKAQTKNSKYRLYTIPARINGESTRLLVDTGATSVYIYTNTALARRLRQATGAVSTPVTSVSGHEKYRLFDNTRVQVGKALEKTRLILVPKSQRHVSGIDGFLGMSFLRRCVLVLKTTDGLAVCK